MLKFSYVLAFQFLQTIQAMPLCPTILADDKGLVQIKKTEKAMD